jgi:hypothetical protein
MVNLSSVAVSRTFRPFSVSNAANLSLGGGSTLASDSSLREGEGGGDDDSASGDPGRK